MPKPNIFSVSLPPPVRALLDAEAERQQRSRSYIVSEAIREYTTRRQEEEFGAARDRTLREGLALTPAERVRLAEDLWRELTRGRKPGKAWTASFETFEDYEQWRRRGGEDQR
ncbi:MAG TPA: ribbon-helix-helix protein, CopG family [Gemmatimonadales bacterium]|nr:ribbon-helix-helix protein, CopG family [Gemmatimonadales bacterium]